MAEYWLLKRAGEKYKPPGQRSPAEFATQADATKYADTSLGGQGWAPVVRTRATPAKPAKRNTDSVRAFLLVPVADQYEFQLRRYSYSSGVACANGGEWHRATVSLGVHSAADAPQPFGHGDVWPHEDARWPVQCSKCTYQFKPEDYWSFDPNRMWRRADGAEGTYAVLHDTPPGAIWRAEWMEDGNHRDWVGLDGHAYIAVCPGGHHWHIDSRASNCDSPCVNCKQPYRVHHDKGHKCKTYEDARPHKCWVRHGEAPRFTVDKNGVTCGAGAGSILTPNWHGFLRQGEFQSC